VAALGTLFVFSGISGASVTGSLRDLVSGGTPKGGANTIVSSSGDETVSGVPIGVTSGNDSNLASLALSYVGMPYVWGGGNPPKGADCSGMVNGACRQLHLAIPGSRTGQYSGHGPVTGQWFVTTICTTVPNSEAQPGDLVCWLTHMGIFVGNGELVSALNPRLGTLKTTISEAAPFGEPMRIRRHK
jgi:cell wall-associated NlpC family hydrolase